MRGLTSLSAGLAASVLLALSSPALAQTIEPLRIDGPTGELAGTLVMPQGATAETPIVLIIPGSGPTNRDGDSPLGVSGSPFRQLAEALAERGIGSIRIDKRGMFASASAAEDPNAVRQTDYAADNRAWMAAIRARTGAPCLWVLGHSEGGLNGTLAVQDNPDACGLILLAASGRPLQDTLRAQIAANVFNAPIMPQVDAILAALEAGQAPDLTNVHPALATQLFPPQLNTYYISLFSHDPAEELARFDGPVLIIQGGTDLQVTLEDANRLAAVRGLEPVVFPEMNHVLRNAPADRAANIASYSDTEAVLTPGLAEAIAGFILQDR